jgi:ubiquinol-cytochrome c reductase cytochrome b subunit/menaquinol-cytochrome c reductase cytochrome b/c subunit
VVAAAAAGCADGGNPTEVTVEDTRSERGKEVLASSGCLGCHSIEGQGNPGPGPDLSDLAERRTRAQIARILINPTAPMPSYQRLQQERPRDFEALVDFLAERR